MSNLLIKGLLVAYIIIFGVCLVEKNWARSLYWLSACGLQVSILWGFK